MLDQSLTPSAIVQRLDEYVIGQEAAKRTVAVAVYAHFRKIAKSARDATAVAKSNILLIGSSGTGKTLLCETLSRTLGVPFVTAEATSLAQTRYMSDEIEAILAAPGRPCRRRRAAGAAGHRVHRRDRQAARRRGRHRAARRARACSTRC